LFSTVTQSYGTLRATFDKGAAPAPQDKGWSGRHPDRLAPIWMFMSTARSPKTLDSTSPEAWPCLLRVARLAGRPLERSVLVPADVSSTARTTDEAEGSTVA
jgi:hypothetical protein